MSVNVDFGRMRHSVLKAVTFVMFAMVVVSSLLVSSSDDVWSDVGAVSAVDDFEFTVISEDEGTVGITGYSGTGGHVPIPEATTVGGREYVVTAIGNKTFDGCTTITSVVIPHSITSVGDYAFRGCTALASVDIPDNVITIGRYAFKECGSLSSVSFGTGLGAIAADAFSGCSSLTSLSIPGNIASIGESAFYGCSSLTSVTLEDGVGSIGPYAFNRCYSLASIDIPGTLGTIGNYAFQKCSSLPEVRFPMGVGSIGIDAFSDCTALASVDLPDSLTTLGRAAFGGCSSLRSVTFGTGLTSIANQTFEDCTSLPSISIPDGITSVGNNAFRGCTSLTSVSLPPGLSSIGRGAFDGCHSLVEVLNNSDLELTPGSSDHGYVAYRALNIYSLDSGRSMMFHHQDFTFILHDGGHHLVKYTGGDSDVTLPSNPRDGDVEVPSYTILRYAFFGFASLSSVVIPDCVTSIGDLAFYGCTSLVRIDVPDSVTSIGTESFGECTSLAYVGIGRGLASIGEDAFLECWSLERYRVSSDNPNYSSDGNGVLLDGTGSTLLSYPMANPSTSYRIGDGVVHILGHAFSGCVFLTSVTIGDGVTVIDDDAFNGCLSLVSVVIGERTTSIGKHAFYGCSSLSSVIIPDSVVTVEEYAFYGCSSLAYVLIGANVSTIGDYAFHGCSSMEDLTIGASVTGIGNYSFRGCTALLTLVLPESVQSIGNYAFYNCSGLSSVTLGGGVVSIGNYAFRGCTSLFTLSMSEGLSSIGDGSFYGCSSLGPVVIPDSVVSLGTRAFHGCTSMTHIVIGKGVMSVGTYAFNGCYALGTVNNRSFLDIRAGDTDYGYVAFYANTVNGGPVRDTVGDLTVVYNQLSRIYRVDGYSGSDTVLELSKLVIGGEEYVLVEIGDAAFEGHYSFTRIVISDSVLVIGDRAFGDLRFLIGGTILPDTGLSVLAGRTLVSIVEGTFIDSDEVMSFELELEGGHYDITPTGWVFDDGRYVSVSRYSELVLTDPSREGYLFDGWTVSIGVPIVYAATWVADSYTVSFDSNGGVEVDVTIEVTFDLPYGELPVPEREGYAFIEWSTAPQGGKPIHSDSLVSIACDHVLYALWAPKVYEVSFNVDGVPIEGYPIDAEYDSVIPIPTTVPSLDRVGDVAFSFKCWEGFREGITVSGDMSFEAVFVGRIDSFSGNDDGDLVIDARSETEVIMDAHVLGKLLRALGVGSKAVVCLSEGYIGFDLGSLLRLDGGEMLTIVMVEGPDSDDDVSSKVGDRPVYEVSVGDIHDFGDGVLTIGLDYVLSDGESAGNLVIWHFGSDGSRATLPCTYDPNGRHVEFDTCQLSRFAIMHVAEPGNDEDAGIFMGAGFVEGIVISALTVFGTLAFLSIRRRM